MSGFCDDNELSHPDPSVYVLSSLKLPWAEILLLTSSFSPLHLMRSGTGMVCVFTPL